jgi:hypothetical protein
MLAIDWVLTETELLVVDGLEETGGATIDCRKSESRLSLFYEYFCASARPGQPPSVPALRVPKGQKRHEKFFCGLSRVTH